MYTPLRSNDLQSAAGGLRAGSIVMGSMCVGFETPKTTPTATVKYAKCYECVACDEKRSVLKLKHRSDRNVACRIHRGARTLETPDTTRGGSRACSASPFTRDAQYLSAITGGHQQAKFESFDGGWRSLTMTRTTHTTRCPIVLSVSSSTSFFATIRAPCGQWAPVCPGYSQDRPGHRARAPNASQEITASYRAD